MKIKFVKDIVAFKKNFKQGEILEVKETDKDTVFVLSSGLAERVIEDRKKRVMKRKKA